MSTVETQARPAQSRSIPIGYDKQLMVTAGRASMELGGKIAAKLGVDLTDAGLKTFANGEVYCKYQDSIRGADLFIIQSTCTNEAEGLTANDALMELMCMIDAVVEAGATIGPFAYLRPGTVIGENAKIGTFVEAKSSNIGAGAKVPHLSYLGDADVGEDANVAAGNITANYDGFTKSRTKIGKRAKTGVNNSFVAPVTVGDDAYTGAGSVIGEDVPDGALGIARAEQKNDEGYAERAKQRKGS